MTLRTSCVLGAALIAGLMQMPAAAGDQMGELETQVVSYRRALEEGMDYDGGSCCGSSCCNTSCCYHKRCCRSSVYGGAELVYVKVYQQGDNAFDVLDPGNTQNNVAPFDADYEMTPRMWVGYKDGCGLGVRATYWEYDHLVDVQTANLTDGNIGATPVSQVVVNAFGSTFTNTPPDPIRAQYDLEVNVWDLDVTQDFCICGTDVTIAGGVRHAHYRSNYSAVITSTVFPPVAVFMNHSFNGWGPTFAIEGKRSLGWGGLDFYAGTRQSVLFGQSHETIFSAPQFAASSFSAATRQEALAITEARIGLEWSQYLNCTSRVFARAGWEGQYWHAAGTANNGALDLGFQGFSLAAGVEYQTSRANTPPSLTSTALSFLRNGRVFLFSQSALAWHKDQFRRKLA